jgi:hypothetical protein
VLGLLRVEGSLAAHLLQARGVKAEAVRERLATASASRGAIAKEGRNDYARLKLDSFLAGLKWHKSEELIDSFDQTLTIH